MCGFFSSLISIQFLGCSVQLILQIRGLSFHQWVQVSRYPSLLPQTWDRKAEITEKMSALALSGNVGPQFIS